MNLREKQRIYQGYSCDIFKLRINGFSPAAAKQSALISKRYYHQTLALLGQLRLVS